MKKIFITGVIVIAALAGIMYVLNNNKKENDSQTAVVAQKNAAVAVRATEAGIKEVNNVYVTNGTFLPKQEVKLSAEVAGRVARVLVEEGAYVKTGQTLAFIVMQGGYNGWHNDVSCNVISTLEDIGARVSPGEYPFVSFNQVSNGF